VIVIAVVELFSSQVSIWSQLSSILKIGF